MTLICGVKENFTQFVGIQKKKSVNYLKLVQKLFLKSHGINDETMEFKLKNRRQWDCTSNSCSVSTVYSPATFRHCPSTLSRTPIAFSSGFASTAWLDLTLTQRRNSLSITWSSCLSRLSSEMRDNCSTIICGMGYTSE